MLIVLIGFSRLYLGAHFLMDVLVGWTAGGGLEYAILPNMTIKGEYFFVDLGSHSAVYPVTFSASPVTANYKPKENIVRFSLNFKFGP